MRLMTQILSHFIVIFFFPRFDFEIARVNQLQFQRDIAVRFLKNALNWHRVSNMFETPGCRGDGHIALKLPLNSVFKTTA